MLVLLVKQTFRLWGPLNASVFLEICWKGHWKCALYFLLYFSCKYVLGVARATFSWSVSWSLVPFSPYQRPVRNEKKQVLQTDEQRWWLLSGGASAILAHNASPVQGSATAPSTQIWVNCSQLQLWSQLPGHGAFSGSQFSMSDKAAGLEEKPCSGKDVLTMYWSPQITCKLHF